MNLLTIFKEQNIFHIIREKKSILLPAIALIAFAFSAQAAGENWLTDYEKALSKAKEENKIILVEFHGSDWCPPCMKLNDEVLKTSAFKSFADEKLILVDADFPRTTDLPEKVKAQNEELAKKFGVRYFPTVVLLDADENVLDKMVGFPKGGLDGFLSFVKKQVPSEG